MVKGTRLESKFPHLQTSPLRKGWIFFVQEEGPPGTRVNSVWPYPLLYGTPLPPHIPPYIGVFWVLVEGGQCRERNFFGKKVEKLETPPICEKKIFQNFWGKLGLSSLRIHYGNQIQHI
jgi:hypothetical protein